MPIDETAWGVQSKFSAKPVANFGNLNTEGWPTETRSCRICDTMIHLPIHPDAHAEWSENRESDTIGAKVTSMALKGATCDRCGNARQMFLEAREGVSAIAIELLRARSPDGSNLTEKQEELLGVNLRKRLKRYCEALRIMNMGLNVIWDEQFVSLIWDKPQGSWRFLRGMAKFLYSGKPVNDQMASMIRWLQQMKSAS